MLRRTQRDNSLCSLGVFMLNLRLCKGVTNVLSSYLQISPLAVGIVESLEITHFQC